MQTYWQQSSNSLADALRARACSHIRKDRAFSGPLKITLVFLLALAMSLSLMGCRDSDVLTQKIIDAPGVSETDYSLDTVYYDNRAAEGEAASNLYEQESQSQDHEKQQNQPEYQQDNPTTDQAADKQPYSGTANLNGQSSEGGQADQRSGSAADPSGNDTSRGPAPGEGDGNNEGAGPSDENPRGRTIEIETPDLTDEPQPEDNSPSPNQGQNAGSNDNTWSPSPNGNGGGTGEDSQGSTYADGTYDTIPSAGKVAASGPYATIVQSLGGRGALAAAPQQWLDNLPSGAYDNGNELIDVKGISAWGDGRQMTDAAVQGIIDSGADVVLTSSTYNVMNQDQANALNAAGVDVLVVPDIGIQSALDADIVMTVDVIGELLKDAGTSIQFDSKQAAATWKSMHNSTLETCLDNNGGYTCAQWGMQLENYKYQGIDYVAKRSTISNVSANHVYVAIVDYWADGADHGASNYVGISGTPGSFNLIDYYFQHAGAHRGATATTTYLSNAAGGRMGVNMNVPRSTDGWSSAYNPDGLSTPVVIARNERIAVNVASYAGVEGSEYNLGYDYNVFVMPEGVSGSWNDGNFESFLVAPWAYSILRESGTAQADQFVNDFYSTFYRSGASTLVSGYGVVVQARCTS